MNEDKAPIASALTDYHRQDRYGFTPGHRQGRGAAENALAVLGRDTYPSDVLASAGLDDSSSTEHEEDKSTWTLNMLEDDQGFIFRDTVQAQFVSGLAVRGLPQMVKTRDSAFLGTDLLLRLRNWNVDTIVLAGVPHTTASHRQRRMPPSGTFSAANTGSRFSRTRRS